MPKIEVSHKDLCSMIGRKLSVEQLNDELLYAKTELDEVNGDLLKIDVKDTNRPDLWSAEGVAREIRGRYKSGLPTYVVKKSSYVVNVDSSLERIRPYTVCAVVKGLRINDIVLSQMIQLQEKVAGTFGSNRKNVAIGVYDANKIKFPVKFTTVKPDGIKFLALDMKDKLTPRELLEKHPKGKEFGHLLNGKDLYPIFIDSVGEVLSIPPIINSDHTGKVTEKTKDVFIECSGHDMKFLNTALSTLVAALHERGGIIYSVKVNYGKKTFTTPDLTPKKFFSNIDYIRKIVGLDLDEKTIIKLLEQSLYSAKLKGKKFELEYPAFRQDIMHERDVIEDVLISYGFNKITPETPKLITKGGLSQSQVFSDTITELMIGAGLQEVLSYTLTNNDYLFGKMNIKGGAIEIENAVSSNWSVFRTSILPGLLEFLSKNKHVEYPHSVFEIGTVVCSDESSETKSKDKNNLSVAISSTNANYETISSITDALFKNLGLEYSLNKSSHPSFIEGRTAEIIFNNKSIGFIGEIHPEVLNNWGLEKPVLAFEINLDVLMEKFKN